VFNSGSLRGVSPDWRIGSEVRGDDPYMGMVNSEPVFLATRQSSYEARGVFFSDNRGGIFYVTFEDPETNAPYDSWDDWKIYTVASLRGSGDASTDSYSIPWGLVAGGSSGGLYVSGGTANAVRADPTNDGNQHLFNKSQMIFAFAMPDIAAAPNEGGKKSERGDWAQLSADVSNDVLSAEEEAKRKNNGWYIPLREADNNANGYLEEYVTTRPVLSGGNLYVATFMQERIDTTSAGSCETGSSLMGKSRLYVISLETGSSALSDSDKKYHELDGVKIVNVMEIGDKIALRAAELDAEAVKNNEISKKISITQMGEGDMGVNLMSLEKDLLNDDDEDEDEELSDGDSPNVTPNDTIINYWLYK
jgi:hypothetical protein